MQYAWFRGRSILVVMKHQEELTQLVTWAKRKKLPGPLRRYQSLLEDADQRLFVAQVRTPYLFEACQFASTARKQLFPVPHYRRRGSAAMYRRR